MKSIVAITDRVSTQAIRSRGAAELLQINGIYRIQHFRSGKLIKEYECSNTVTTEGKRYLLDAALDNSAGGYTEKTAWYIGLVDNAQTHDTPAVGLIYDTFFDGTHNTEFTSYSGGARVTWNAAIHSTNDSISNVDNRATFTFTGSGVLYGAALVSNSTFNHHTAGDYLMSYAAFSPGTISVGNTDVVNVQIDLAFS